MENLLTQLGITKEELIDRIVVKALGTTADYEQTDAESWRDIPLSEVVNRKITEAIGNLIERMKPMIQTRIDETMNVEIEKVFTLPFQPVDRWGKAVGEPTTIRDFIATEAETYWHTKVDLTTGEKDKSGYGRDQVERAVYYARKVMIDYYNQELISEVRKMAKQLKDRIPVTIAEEISKTVIRYIG